MAKINVPPTRSNLIRMKQELRFAREGYEILDRKREVLTTELVRVAHEAETVQKEVWALLDSAYRALERARLTLGGDHVEWALIGDKAGRENKLQRPKVFQKEGHADGRDERGDAGGVAQRLVSHPLDRNSQHRANEHREQDDG